MVCINPEENTFIDTETTTDCSPGSISCSICNLVIVKEHDLLKHSITTYQSSPCLPGYTVRRDFPYFPRGKELHRQGATVSPVSCLYSLRGIHHHGGHFYFVKPRLITFETPTHQPRPV